MRIRNFLIAVAVLALAVPGFANAQSGFKVTGGGQTTPGNAEQYAGPGDTFGFNARATGEPTSGIYPASGQFNHIDRDETAPGDGQRGRGDHIKGVVICLEATGPNSAQFGGRLNEPGPEGELYFVVDVIDSDQGQSGNDLIIYQPTNNDEPCDEDEADDDIQLSRGNLQIHNNPEAP